MPSGGIPGAPFAPSGGAGGILLPDVSMAMMRTSIAVRIEIVFFIFSLLSLSKTFLDQIPEIELKENRKKM
jgi:hypothetical protein